MNIKKFLVGLLFAIGLPLSAGFQENGNYIAFQKKLALRAVENQTINSTFKLFYSNSESLALLEPQSVFLLQPEELFLQPHEILCIKCIKGSFLTMYIKDEGKVSGQAPEGFYGPFYLSMWLQYPEVSDDQKQYVRYVVEHGKQAEFAVRINAHGDCQIIALKHMELLP